MLIVDAERIAEKARAWLAERAEVVVCAAGDRTRLLELLARAEGLIVRTYTVVDEALLDRAPRLRVVGRAGVGLDNIDVSACRARGVEVVHTPEANAPAVAEYVFALLLDALRPRPRLEEAVSADAWNRLRDEAVAARQLGDLTLGIWGLGRVGTRVARAGAAFGMKVFYHDLRGIPPEVRAGAEPVTAGELLAASDVLSLHVDERPSNRHLVDAVALARLRPEAILVNTSRGFVIDSAALAAHLRGHPGALALLDVHDPEPVPAGSPLWGLRNVRLHPHLGSATRTAKDRMSLVVHDVWRVLSGEPPRHPAP